MALVAHPCVAVLQAMRHGELMSYYRDTYLKSDDWKSLRLIAIQKNANSGGVCPICARRVESLDVHHLKYRRLFNVTPKDLKAVCRECHDKIHELLKKYPKMKYLNREVLWFTVCAHLGTPKIRAHCAEILAKRIEKAGMEKERKLRRRNHRIGLSHLNHPMKVT